MGNVLLVVGVSAALLVVGVITMTWTVWRGVRRHNEVCPSHPIRPPLRWLASPESAARLHRHLRDAVLVMRRAVPKPRGWRRRESSTFELLAAQIETHAVSLDHELFLVARLRGPDGTEARRRVADQVAELERTAHRLAAVSVRSASSTGESTDVALRHIAEQLDAHQAAWDELSVLEEKAGLRLRV
jgi:hypothetical protein